MVVVVVVGGDPSAGEKHKLDGGVRPILRGIHGAAKGGVALDHFEPHQYTKSPPWLLMQWWTVIRSWCVDSMPIELCGDTTIVSNLRASSHSLHR